MPLPTLVLAALIAPGLPEPWLEDPVAEETIERPRREQQPPRPPPQHRSHRSPVGLFVWVAIIPAIMAARNAQLQRQEEENETPYAEEEPMEEWEYKIVRNGLGRFDRRGFLDQILKEEARAGWQFVEKLDGSRVRLKRPASQRSNDGSLPADYDPYRTKVGPGGGRIALIVLGIIAGIGVVVAGVIFLVTSSKSAESKVVQVAPMVGVDPPRPAEEASYKGRSTSAWIKQLKDRDPSYRQAAAVALAAIGPDAKTTLPQPSSNRRLDAVSALNAALKDEDENVRKEAAAALKKIDPEAATKAGVP